MLSLSNKNKYLITISLLVFVLTGVILLILALYNSYSPNSLPILVNTLSSRIPVLKPDSSLTQSSKIEKAIQTIISSYPQLNFGISFIDFNNGNKADINGNKIFAGASTTKVLIASLLLSQVETGKYNLEQDINGVSLKQLLQQMINRSNNDDWAILMDFIGFQYQQSYARSIGITSYDVTNNRIDSNDMALLLEKLYTGKLLNAQNTKLLLSYMQHTNNDDLIPPAVPDGISVYHKYGSYNGDLHDAAIIDDGKNPFALVIFTATGSGTLTYAKRLPVFHDIVTAVENANKIK